jgi:hypothetical protein
MGEWYDVKLYKSEARLKVFSTSKLMQDTLTTIQLKNVILIRIDADFEVHASHDPSLANQKTKVC